MSVRALNHLKEADERMAALIGQIGPYRIRYSEPTFEALTRAIVYQQLNGRAAATIYGRFKDAAGEVTPDRVLAIPPSDLKKLGLSTRKAEYVHDLAAKTAGGHLPFHSFPSWPDDQIIDCLTEVRGIGRWTVHMFLMFALRRPDVLPTGDLGIRTAMKRLYRMRQLPNEDRMHRVASPWKPYRSVACWYLWRSLDGEAALD